ncbi:MAG: right-handed parallel beta-helix repeat-containing protein [Verrucomicrobiae bacterium]|nr:right-handed parallel beta-helix repeat-containing protein [Verrucomicrobiae bacterium]
MPEIRRYLHLLLPLMWMQVAWPATYYYLDGNGGNDGNPGTSPDQAWASLAKVSSASYGPGDRILLKRGDSYTGKLLLLNQSGTEEAPIVIASYGEGAKPYIDAAGYLAGVEIQNSHYVEVQDLEITADGGTTVDGSSPGERYGVLVRATNGGSISHVSIRDMTIHHIFPEVDTEHEGKNPTTFLGTGIRLSGIADTTSSDFVVENCDIRTVGFKMVEMQRVSYVEILNNYGEKIGGPALQASRVDDLLVRGNTINGSGDFSDPRMHGRGSGIWPWTSNRVLIEKNQFMHARGRADSCGAHIDFNCTDVVVQYNLSYDNEGGFVEILGNNRNCAYRYNISINDGARVSGENGANAHGNILWTSGYVGSGNPQDGPYNSYIYNNTIYVAENQRAGFRLENTTSGVLIANNIFFLAGPTANHTQAEWSQENLDKAVFKNNLFQRSGLLPSSLQIKDNEPLIGDPGFANEGGNEPKDYETFFFENVKDKGIAIPKIPGDTLGLRIGLEVTEDFFGNPIVGLPDLGAVETGDTRPPLPEAASFATDPEPLDSSSVQMKGMRVFEPVEYFFEELSGNLGGSNSDWQSDRNFKDEGLLPNTTYQYRVMVRDGQGQLLAGSVTAQTTTPPVDPFEDKVLYTEDFSSPSFINNTSAPFPANTWHLDDSNDWSRDNSGTSVGVESSIGPVLRLGWGFDEVEIRYFLDDTIDMTRDYQFSGNWEIKSLLDNSLGFIAGFGEYDKDTGSLVKRIKETVFGEFSNPQVGQSGQFSVTLTRAELAAAGVDPENKLGVFFHHDDNGTLFQEAADNNGRNDVYLVDNLAITQLARVVDSDMDGLSDAFEEMYHLDSSEAEDAESDPDMDGLSSLAEQLFGTDPKQYSTTFLPPVSWDGTQRDLSVPSTEFHEGRAYILEYSSDLGQTDPWQAVDLRIPGIEALNSGITFTPEVLSQNGFFRIRIEWAD